MVGSLAYALGFMYNVDKRWREEAEKLNESVPLTTEPTTTLRESVEGQPPGP